MKDTVNWKIIEARSFSFKQRITETLLDGCGCVIADKIARDVAQVHMLLIFTEETCIFTSIDTSLVSALFK